MVVLSEPPGIQRINKTRNTEPLCELNQTTSITEISATCASFKQREVFESQSSVPVHCLLGFACFLFLLW